MRVAGSFTAARRNARRVAGQVGAASYVSWVLVAAQSFVERRRLFTRGVTQIRGPIAAALDRIDAEDPATARVLRRTIHTGSVCRYERDPDTPIDWLL